MCTNQAIHNVAYNTAITKDILTGTNKQVSFKLQIYEQIKIDTLKVWRELPSMSELPSMFLDLTSIHQNPDETIQDCAGK